MRLMKYAPVAFLMGISATSAGAVAPPVDWSGWYIGGFGSHIDGKLIEDGTHAPTTGDYDDNGFMFGVHGGYRHQTAGNWVIGGEIIVPVYMEKGTAVDTFFFPGLVEYEAKGKFAIMASIQVGKPVGNVLPFIYGSAGIAKVEGRTLNVDENDMLSPGFVQKDSAWPFIWQAGVGVDVQATRNFIIGGRVGYFEVTEADYTMPWNVPGPNEFGLSGLQTQVTLSYRFKRN